MNNYQTFEINLILPERENEYVQMTCIPRLKEVIEFHTRSGEKLAGVVQHVKYTRVGKYEGAGQSIELYMHQIIKCDA